MGVIDFTSLCYLEICRMLFTTIFNNLKTIGAFYNQQIVDNIIGLIMSLYLNNANNNNWNKVNGTNFKNLRK